jgi:hypothetical protein
MVTDASNGNGAVWVSSAPRSAYSAVVITRRADGSIRVRVVNADTVTR